MAATLELRLSSLDAMRVPRGHCLSCDWCPRFLSPSKRILCDYCGCPPAKHHRVDNDNDDPNKKNKKMRLAAKVASSSGTPSSEDEDEEVGPESIKKKGLSFAFGLRNHFEFWLDIPYTKKKFKNG